MGRASDFCAKVCQLRRISLVPLIAFPLGQSIACSGGEVGPDGSPGADGQPGPLEGSGGGSVIGEECSSDGLRGVVVESRSNCYFDDAFCAPRPDGTFCTGGRPFISPPGQIRLDWLRCGYPEMGGAGGGGGAGGEL